MLSLRHLEILFRLLLPPASREHVLGDLHEKCKSPWRYFVEAVSVLGPVIVSRIRRTTDLQVFLMEAMAVYLSFSAAALWLGQKAFLYDQAGFLRLAISTAVTVAGLLLCNAYSDPGKQFSLIKPILQSAGSLALSFLGQAAIFDTCASLAVPFGIMLYCGCISFVLVSTLRMLFSSVFCDRSRVTLPSEVRALQKPNLIPERAVVQQLEEWISNVQIPHKLNIANILPVALLAAVLLVATIWPSVARVIEPRLPHLVIVLLVVYLVRSRAS